TIQQAVNQAGPGDLIELGPGTYTENVTVNQSVTMLGDAFNGSTVNGNGAGPVFVIDATDTSSNPLTATLNTLTITNGNATSGGGIQNAGTLTVIGCTINANHAPGPSSNGTGGGIENSGALTVINSTISGNSAGASGGGIDNEGASATATAVNSTINGNSAGSGGGIFTGAGATVNLTNTIIAGSVSGGDCVNNGTIGTNDMSLIQDGSCSPAVSGDPKLGPLQNNGGPTFTQALLAGSPAIDAGDDAVLGAPFNLTTDQRSFDFPRKACAHVDIGAYEFASNTPPTVTCPANVTTFTNPGQTTATVSFAATATDLCDGTLTPTYKIGATVISSPHAFPTGVTTVSVSATNSRNLTGTCSFTVTVTALNGCIQDDHTGDTLRFNTQTGQYVYTRCKDKFTLSGTGVAGRSGGFITLTDSKPDRRITASFNPGTLTGRANITLILGPGIFQTITVNQTNPRATCACAS
ncbi:MAG: choice-of-anchor Q domain-containing protein, partial [Blastocatellia bacterium]